MDQVVSQTKPYRQGIIIGKFMPFHMGHQGLIEFGTIRCDKLTVCVCSNKKEPIDGAIRYERVKQTYSNRPEIQVLHITEELPGWRRSTRYASNIRAKYLQELVPEVDVFFSSELYGKYMAEYIHINHEYFDRKRTIIPVSGTKIRNNPRKYRNYLAPIAKPYYCKKIIICGSESTGKSTLAIKLAQYFDTTYVPEMARRTVPETDKIIYKDLQTIAVLHAKAIEEKSRSANKILFVDTDINITKSYSKYLLSKELTVDPWIEEVNHGDLYLYLENDCEYIQDGGRLPKDERNSLNQFHKQQLRQQWIRYHTIHGTNRKDRIQKSIAVVKQFIRSSKYPTTAFNIPSRPLLLTNTYQWKSESRK